jgi:iron-sulfur cluster assembly accessory protein
MSLSDLTRPDPGLADPGAEAVAARGPAGEAGDELPHQGLDQELDEELEGVIPPPRLELSQAAVERIREMLEEEDLVAEGGLRIKARTGAGCSAPMLFNLVLETEPDEDDLVLEGPGIRIFMDPVSAWSLDGLAVDWVDAPGLGEGFAFRHPRGAGGRAC